MVSVIPMMTMLSAVVADEGDRLGRPGIREAGGRRACGQHGPDAGPAALTTLLDLGDLDSVEHVARSAVNVWLAGSAAAAAICVFYRDSSHSELGTIR